MPMLNLESWPREANVREARIELQVEEDVGGLDITVERRG